MGVRDIFPVATDGGTDVHFECRDCGRNLDSGDDRCPECGGDVARYTLQ